ncbi:unnamed protein product, partial [Brachionus calyciflorus]
MYSFIDNNSLYTYLKLIQIKIKNGPRNYSNRPRIQINQQYRYQKNEKKSNWYRCTNRLCGTLFDPNTLKINKIQHYHPPMTQCEIDCLLHFKTVVQVIISDHDVSIADAYNNEYQKLITKYSCEELAEFWKPFSSVNSNLRYHRNKTKPINAKETKDIVINDVYSKINNEQFLQFDNNNHSNRILIFMSPIGMKILANSTRWHLDGTFKTCPTHFHQILSIHGYYQNQMFPAAYILLQNKERETYIEALTEIKLILTSNNIQIKVQELLSDFELA